jgi:hypothetical protein
MGIQTTGKSCPKSYLFQILDRFHVQIGWPWLGLNLQNMNELLYLLFIQEIISATF